MTHINLRNYMPKRSKIRNISPLIITIIIFLNTHFSFANNLSINQVSLEARNPTSKTVIVEFDLSWENSWKTKINHDAIWVTVRLYDPSQSPTDKRLCELSNAGLNPSGTYVGSGSGVEIDVPEDKKGAFIRPSSFGVFPSMQTTNVRLKINYDSCGLESSDQAYVSVFGLEMVYVPEGAFYVGDYDTSSAALDEGTSDNNPWYLASESTISVSNPSSNGFRYVSAQNSGEDPTGLSFTISEAYPKGYAPFYVMKYEITEGQWVEFSNSLSSFGARANRDLTNASHKNTDVALKRNTISCSGSPLSCFSSRPARAVNFLTWMDLSAFLDWAALRPMTELEFEKMSRGPLLPESGEMAWGTTNITAATTISNGAETGAEAVNDSGANVNYNNIFFSGGDTAEGQQYQQGPLRSGIFATIGSNREQAGAGYYGGMELSGNLRERAVTIGNSFGRSFTGEHGDGILSTDPGFEGNANESNWPGMDGISTRGVTTADGSGLRGGGWDEGFSRLRLSDRQDAANGTTAAFDNAGGRGVRSHDINH